MIEAKALVQCPACGTNLSRERESTGLCPSCLIQLALDDTSAEAEIMFEPGEAPTLQFSGDGFSEGDIQGDRYRIRSLLGRGGMGEVWRAYDLKLRLDVALKALRKELVADPQALETLRQEVRVAREVISPNVCRVFDLEEIDGQELVSMEYVDGTTLHEILRDKGPLELNEAREIVTQFLSGLQAIHDAGLVHRDIKPENLMITRTGRVVVMDFGIAKGLGEGKGGMIAGTPAYMSPEQARGGELDASSDLFSVGVVLAEMLEPVGITTFENRKRVWEGIQQSTPQISETPWSQVIAKCVSAEARDRFESASTLARALEEVTLRAAGDETARPYPGLSAFQEEDAEYFYGRELEAEGLWKKLRRPHLLAVVGPSGAGKSSFLRAGLLSTLTDGWQALIATPGNRPFANLTRVLAEQLPEDRSVADALLRFEEPEVALGLIRQWRDGSQHSLIIVDQFEELFTQNGDDTQRAFAELLGRLPLEADVHVLLSMRDDFLFHCHHFEAFQPILSDLTLLGPPTGASLRRAIVQPALKRGYRFEDESIVEEMLTAVEGQRGALPLLAFAAAQLWECRDHESGLLTRKSYEQIGGVGGALAQHAEAVLEKIGDDGIPMVRELFRNLVTAQGTRAARDREELLSVFDGSSIGKAGLRAGPSDDRVVAKEVLNTLIDARLLTSYEVPATDSDDTPHQRIEIVHESLLANWPRLVRWRTQDAQGAQLRDELRAQAKLWDEHGRSEDYLWTGTAFKEYALWREGYPGGLTEEEEAFGAATVHLADRQRHRHRTVVTTVIVVLGIVATVITGLWLQSEEARRQAVEAAQRAEASKLLALAQLELDRDHTIALAYATASLKLADRSEARRFAVETLWRGPPYFRLGNTGDFSHDVRFSPDERWLAVSSPRGGEIRVWSREGGEPVLLEGHGGHAPRLAFAAEAAVLASSHGGDDQTVRLWSVPDGGALRTIRGESGPEWFPAWGVIGLFLSADAGRLITYQSRMDWTIRLQAWELASDASEELATLEAVTGWWESDPSGTLFVFTPPDDATAIHVQSLEAVGTAAPRMIGHTRGDAENCAFDQRATRLACGDVTGEIRVWDLEQGNTGPIRVFQGPARVYPKVRFNGDGTLIASGHENGCVSLWDLSGPQGADPLTVCFESGTDPKGVDIQTGGRWLAASGGSEGTRVWALGRDRARVLRGHEELVGSVVFDPEGKWLVSSGLDGVRQWSLVAADGEEPWRLLIPEHSRIDIDAKGESLVFKPQLPKYSTVGDSRAGILPLAGGPPRFHGMAPRVALSPDGRTVASGGGTAGSPEMVRVWNTETGEERILDTGQDGGVVDLDFVEDDVLVVAYCGDGGCLARTWNLQDDSQKILVEGVESFELDAGGRSLLGLERGGVVFHELGTNRSVPLEGLTGEGETTTLALDPSGSFAVTGGEDRIVRVGSVRGGEPHLLFGHEASVLSVAVSPDGRWIASGGADATIRLWPMPDLSQPPLHTLPHDELITKLESLTNIRVVRDPESREGWSVTLGPFPGWAEVPSWP